MLKNCFQSKRFSESLDSMLNLFYKYRKLLLGNMRWTERLFSMYNKYQIEKIVDYYNLIKNEVWSSVDITFL